MCKGGASRARGSSTGRGYDELFQVLRVRCFVRDEWRCRRCGWEPDIFRLSREARETGLDTVSVPTPSRVLEELRWRFRQKERHLHADHTVPIRVAPELRHDLDNLQTLCSVCHSAKTLGERQ